MESLDIVAQASGNAVVAEAIMDIKTAVREGRPFAEPMRSTRSSRALVVQMVEVGEQTGALDEMLQRVGGLLHGRGRPDGRQPDLDPRALLVVIMGVVVGTIIISLYLPMFDYIKLVH